MVWTPPPFVWKVNSTNLAHRCRKVGGVHPIGLKYFNKFTNQPSVNIEKSQNDQFQPSLYLSIVTVTNCQELLHIFTVK